MAWSLRARGEHGKQHVCLGRADRDRKAAIDCVSVGHLEPGTKLATSQSMVPEDKDEPGEGDVVDINKKDVVDETEDDRRRELQAELFDDDDPFADEGDLDVESEPSW